MNPIHVVARNPRACAEDLSYPNLAIAIVLTPLFNAAGAKQLDERVAADYYP